MRPEDRLAALLQLTAEAHHEAFLATDGVDPNWPAWYARYLLDNGIGDLLGGAPLSATDVTTLLLEAETAHHKEAPEAPWEQFYASRLLTRSR